MADEKRKQFIRNLVGAGMDAIDRINSSKPEQVSGIFVEGLRNIEKVSDSYQRDRDKTLKQILDEFGWEKVQQGQLPPEITPERDDFVQGIHQYDLYALNGVCAVAQDGADIIELSGIAKTTSGYERKAKIPESTKVRVQNASEFLAGFKHLYGFRNRFLFVREEDMHFNGIGKRIEEAGELYKSLKTN